MEEKELKENKIIEENSVEVIIKEEESDVEEKVKKSLIKRLASWYDEHRKLVIGLCR